MLVENDNTDLFETASLTLPPLDWDDPLEDDQPGDVRLDVSRRGMLRVAVAAASTGARFAREGLSADAVGWLLAPRRIFDGESAMDACIDLAPLRRCIALHAPGTGASLDAAPEEIDGILDGPDPSADRQAIGGRRPRLGRGHSAGSMPGAGEEYSQDSGPRLYSCSMIRVEPGARVATFVAGVAADEREFRQRLFERFGAMAALSSEVRVGFNPYDPIVVNLVSERLGDWLAVLAADPSCRVEVSFNVVVEQRTAA